MKDLIKKYLDCGISRRGFLAKLSALGVAASAADSIAQSLAPYLPPGIASAQIVPAASASSKDANGSGGYLLVQQLKMSGIEHIFLSPSSGAAPFFDALVDEPGLHLIEALQEGALAAMGDGYSKASRKTSFVICARPGLTNAMTQIWNSWKDQIPLVMAVDYVDTAQKGEDSFEDADHTDQIAQPITKWSWVAQSTNKIPEVTRRAFKFSATPPCGPVFLGFPEDLLAAEASATVMDQSKFDVSMKIRPDADLVQQAARMLIEAKNPLLLAGDEITWCEGQGEAQQLAELLGMPAMRVASRNQGWSQAFATRHPLYLGDFVRNLRYPGPPDVVLNLGGRLPYGENLGAQAKLIQIRLDATNLARTAPTDVAMFGDLKLSTADLVAAVRSMATDARLKQISGERSEKTAAYTTQARNLRESIARDTWDHSPMNHDRLGVELERALEKDTLLVTDIDSGKPMQSLLSLGGADKQLFSTSGAALGWGLPAAFGVKLAQPDKPVVAILGDGGFLFGGPQALWSFARYSVPATIVICNNRSYNNERNRIWATGGRQFQTGKDLTCYLGNPDIDYVQMAASFGVKGEAVKEPGDLAAALQRSKQITAAGEPYVLDVFLERDGIGAASTWHPSYSVADLRQRKV